MFHAGSSYRIWRPGNTGLVSISKLLLGRGSIVNAALEHLGTVYNSWA